MFNSSQSDKFYKTNSNHSNTSLDDNSVILQSTKVKDQPIRHYKVNLNKASIKSTTKRKEYLSHLLNKDIKTKAFETPQFRTESTKT